MCKVINGIKNKANELAIRAHMAIANQRGD